MEDKVAVRDSVVVPELYFLISKFLSNGPLKNSAKILAEELEHLKILPKRLDWTGDEHEQTFEELEAKFSHIGPAHLLKLCTRIGPILDRELPPSVSGVVSLLGCGRQSLLRTPETVSKPRQILEYCSRFNKMPMMDAVNRKKCHNIVQVLHGRQAGGPITRRFVIQPTFYSKMSLMRTTLGHLTAVYCVLFDRSGKYILTGADDLLVKLWSAIDGRLLASFRGASAEITDMAVNLDNTLLAAGSIDRILRVWDMQTCAPVAVLTAHTGMITSVNFCPSPSRDLKYLVTTSTDGSIAFWQYTISNRKTVFASKPIQYLEKLRPGQAKMICASFSPGGAFLAAGSADNHVRVYIMSEDGPKRILEIESHCETVDSIQWAHHGLRFVSGSKDGTAQIWHFETQQWKNIKLNMSDRLVGMPPPEDENKKFKVTMVAWDLSDKFIITAVNDFTIKVWNSTTCKLHKVLEGHTDEVYVLESHPKDIHICFSAGHDGQLFIWDVCEGIILNNFKNYVEHQLHGGIYDAKWSPDGSMIAATDSHGHILMFGFGSGHERLKTMPKELFFHTDYRPLIRDSNFYVMDEQTQTAPHLMPPPFLVDIDGNPHPPPYQRLVPGRENCPTDQLVPNQEMYEQNEEQPRSDIDRLIEALANRQEGASGPENQDNASQQRRGSTRRSNDIEGGRLNSGTWQRDGTLKYIRRTYVKQMNYSVLQHLKKTVYNSGLYEQELYKREMRKRPLMINTSNNTSRPSASLGRGARARARGRANQQAGYRTRAREPPPTEDEPEEHLTSSSSTSEESTAIEEDMELSDSSTTDTESSDYSDWVANEPGPVNLQPPKRSKRKPVERRTYSPTNGESSSALQENRSERKKKLPIPVEGGEIPEIYRPPEWLSEVIPRKAPYYPQMGDEIYYLRQGHQRYLEAVRSKKVYDPGNRCEPWGYMELRAHELCKVIGIKYEIKPPRLCCLKVGIMDEEGHLTGQSFTIKYHDMPDVLDFLVLRQTFEVAISRDWGPGQRFRCMIDDSWWMGRIDSNNHLSSEFSDSYFMCFKVRWDNGEFEFMSPWDLEQIDEDRLPQEEGGAVPVLPRELSATLYQPNDEEWPNGGRDEATPRIVSGLEQVMGLAIADPFLAPVDLSLYPAYAFVVEYPIDLTTIKARFENHFYRRITSAQFDVRYLATNAEKFNQTHSNIVKNGRIITELCLRILREPDFVDVSSTYRQLLESYASSDSDDEPQPGTSTSTASRNQKRQPGSRRSRRLVPDGDWHAECRELLEMIWSCEDSEPFREPVDTLEHPDYLQVIEAPMDLRTVKEDVLGENYDTPMEFAKDMRLIFQNSRSYNTNKRSRIYAMTLRLSTLFEAHIKSIIYNWKSAKRRGKIGTPRKQPPKSKERKQKRRSDPGPSNPADDDSDPGDSTRKRPRSSRRTGVVSNGGPSTSFASTSYSEPQPGSSKRSRTKREATPPQESEATSSETESDESSGIPVAALGVTRSLRKRTKNDEDNENDSGDSYKPYTRRKNKKSGRRKGKPSKNSASTSTPAKKGTRTRKSTSVDEAEQEEEEDEVSSGMAEGSASDPTSEHDSASADVLLSETDRPLRTRGMRVRQHNNSSADQAPDNIDGDRKRRRNRYESDHSFHLEPRTRRNLVVDSDSEHEVTRPTRNSIRRALGTWGQMTDSLEETPSADEPINRRSTRRRTQITDSDNSPEETSISKRVAVNRSTRSTRHQSSNEDAPGTSTRASRTRAQAQPAIQSATSFRDAPRSETATENITRSTRTRMIPLRSQVGFSATQQNHRPIIPHEVHHDHNYGEPRRHLSRHQMNLSDEDERESLSSRLRHRTLVNNSNITTSSNTNGTTTSPRRPTRSTRLQNSDSDDDNTPLNIVASSTRQRRQIGSEEDREAGPSSASRSMRSQRRGHLRHPQLGSDEDQEAGPSNGSRSMRSRKRPHYNEDSDVSAADGQSRAKKVFTRSTSSSDSGGDNERPSRIPSISRVSGRVRRLNPRVRNLLRE